MKKPQKGARKKIMITSESSKDLPVEECNVATLRSFATAKGIKKLEQIEEDGSTKPIRTASARASDLCRELKDRGYTHVSEEFLKKGDRKPKKKAEKTETAIATEIQSKIQLKIKPELQPQVQPEIQSEPQKEPYILDRLGLTPEEKTEVETAVKISGTILDQLIKEGLLMKARKLITEYSKLSEMTEEQKRQSTLAGAAIVRLKQATDAIVSWNHAQYNNDLRVYINPSILRTLIGSNMDSIKHFLVSYRTNDQFLETAQEHNQRYGLEERDNRKGRDQFGNRIRIKELLRAYISVDNAPVIMPQQQPEPELQPEQQPSNVIEFKAQPKPEVLPQEELEFKPLSGVLDMAAIVSLPNSEFAARVNGLPEYEVKAICEAKMNALRKENGSKSVHSLSKLVTAVREEFSAFKLDTNNTYEHKYKTPRTLKTFNGNIPGGAVFSEDGSSIISEPRHMALKYLRLNEQEIEELKSKKVAG